MSAPASRKSFLSKLALYAAALAVMPRLLRGRPAPDGESGAETAGAPRTVDGRPAVRHDPRTVARGMPED